MDLNLRQREVAVIIGVDKTTIENWEQSRSNPNLRAWPAVLEFLGYNPLPEGRTIGEALRRHRWTLGLSCAEAAKTMDIDPGTLARWERGEREPQGRYLGLVEEFLDVQ